jgi:hypothetical protein
VGGAVYDIVTLRTAKDDDDVEETRSYIQFTNSTDFCMLTYDPASSASSASIWAMILARSCARRILSNTTLS